MTLRYVKSEGQFFRKGIRDFKIDMIGLLFFATADLWYNRF